MSAMKYRCTFFVHISD